MMEDSFTNKYHVFHEYQEKKMPLVTLDKNIWLRYSNSLEITYNFPSTYPMITRIMSTFLGQVMMMMMISPFHSSDGFALLANKAWWFNLIR